MIYSQDDLIDMAYDAVVTRQIADLHYHWKLPLVRVKDRVEGDVQLYLDYIRDHEKYRQEADDRASCLTARNGTNLKDYAVTMVGYMMHLKCMEYAVELESLRALAIEVCAALNNVPVGAGIDCSDLTIGDKHYYATIAINGDVDRWDYDLYTR